MFTKKLVPDIDSSRLRGINVATIGVVCVLVGLLLFFLGLQFVGRIILYAGFFVTFCGVGLHFFILLNQRKPN